jgi:hypothetical protein
MARPLRSNTDHWHRLYAASSWNISRGESLNRLQYRPALPYTITTGLDINGDTIFRSRSQRMFALIFYASAVNIFNQTSLQNFVGVQASVLFRQAIPADRPRHIETGVRLDFLSAGILVRHTS